MTRALRRAGVGFIVLYAAVALATHALTGGEGRPLFDGFAPPAPYRWVNPPPEFAADNMRPESAERLVPLGEAGSEPTNASTPDAQIIIGLPRGAIAAHPPGTAVLLRIVPRDAAQLGPLPPGLRIVANAYEVTMNYQPSQEPVPGVELVASIAMTAATQGDTLLYSKDAQQWAPQTSRPFGNTHGLLGTFIGSGYYLVAASPTASSTTTPPPAAEGGGSGPLIVFVGGAAVVAGVGYVVVTIQRRRAAAAAAKRRKGKRKRK